jgi:hypothetical protein
MNFKDLLPWVGKGGTSKRWRELEKRAGTLPVFFALFFSEFVKILTLSFPNYSLSTIFDLLTLFILSALTALLYVYDIDGDVISDNIDIELDDD